MSAATRAAQRGRLHLPIERFTLKCGAQLLVSPRPEASVFAVQVHLRGGRALDPAGFEGLAHLTGALATEGTEQHTESELAALLEPTGGSVSGSASGVAGSVAGSQWKLLLACLAEVLTTPTYPQERFERQRARLLARLTVDEDDPRVQVGRVFRRLIYGDTWLGRPDAGTAQSVQAITREHLVEHHRQNWVASRALISVCGNVEPAAVRRELNRLLGDWKPGEPFETLKLEFPERTTRVGAFTADRQQVHVLLGHLGIRRSDPDYPALVVMDHILGTGPGFTNRIARRLRDEQGLAYSVDAQIASSAGRQPGMFQAYIGTSPDNVETAIEGFLAEIQRMRDTLVSPKELRLAQDYLTGSFVLGFERSSRRASYMALAERLGLPEEHLDELPAQFAAVTRKSVREAARRHLNPEGLSLATGGPLEASALEDLAKRHLG